MEEKNTKDTIEKKEEKEENANNKKKGEEELTKVDKMFQKIFFILLILTIIGTIILLLNGVSFKQKLQKLHPEYHFVGWYEIIISFLIVPALVYSKTLLFKILSPFIGNYLAKEYLVDEERKKKAELKFMTNIYKEIYFTSITIFGHISLLEYDWYPKSLLGHGDLKNMFAKGYPGSFLFKKTFLFELHYMISLAYAIADIVWLYLESNRNDFINMLFHHICTASLLFFSYIVNYSNIGAVVQVLHNAADAIIYFNRVLIYANVSDKIKRPTPITLLSGFIYFRMFCLAQCIHAIYVYIDWKWESITTSLFTFLLFLYIIHIYWVYVILKKFYDALFKGKFTDSFDVSNKKKKKESQGNEKKTQ